MLRLNNKNNIMKTIIPKAIKQIEYFVCVVLQLLLFLSPVPAGAAVHLRSIDPAGGCGAGLGGAAGLVVHGRFGDGVRGRFARARAGAQGE